MKIMMRCLVLTLALAVYSFAEVRFVEIQNLDKFQSSRYKTLSFEIIKFYDVLFVFDTKEDEYEDLAVAYQCPAGDTFVLKYEYTNEQIFISKVDTSSLKIPDNVELSINNSCFKKIGQRAKANQLTETDDAFLRKYSKAFISGLCEQLKQIKISDPVQAVFVIRDLKNTFNKTPPAYAKYFIDEYTKQTGEPW